MSHNYALYMKAYINFGLLHFFYVPNIAIFGTKNVLKKLALIFPMF